MSFIQINTETEKPRSAIATKELDVVLMLQFFVSWAGEGKGLTELSRLNWWSTQLLDEDTGGDFFKRLLPRTSTISSNKITDFQRS